MAIPESLDDQIEWFHELAARRADELQDWARAVGVQEFNEFIKSHLVGAESAAFASPEELADAVTSLRANERAWNQALQRALIAADELYKQRSPVEAKTLLLQFAKGCPWVGYREVAENQASWY